MLRNELRSLIDYNPESGQVFLCGRLAKTINAGGYVVTSINKQKYYAHRLAWLFMTGKWPVHIDHKNHIPSDNRWTNLREATKSQNGRNRGAQKNNSTGLKGAYRQDNSSGRYFSFIKYNGKRVHLGCFATAEEAHAAFMRTARELHGEFYYGEKENQV